jgi:mono/diheme cytochrome c family protein
MTRLAVLVLVFLAAAVQAADGANEHGREVYRKWCAPCHAPGPEHHPGTEALAAKYRGEKPGALEDRDDLTVEFTKQMVRQGVSIMPFFRKTEISDADLDALAAYLARKN